MIGKAGPLPVIRHMPSHRCQATQIRNSIPVVQPALPARTSLIVHGVTPGTLLLRNRSVPLGDTSCLRYPVTVPVMVDIEIFGHPDLLSDRDLSRRSRLALTACQKQQQHQERTEYSSRNGKTFHSFQFLLWQQHSRATTGIDTCYQSGHDKSHKIPGESSVILS